MHLRVTRTQTQKTNPGYAANEAMESLGGHLNVNKMTVKWAIFAGGFTLRVGRIKASQGGS